MDESLRRASQVTNDTSKSERRVVFDSSCEHSSRDKEEDANTVKAKPSVNLVLKSLLQRVSPRNGHNTMWQRKPEIDEADLRDSVPLSCAR